MVSSEFANFSHKHVGFSPDDFIQSASEIAATAGIIADRVDEMKVIEMTPDERGIYAQAALSLVYDEPESAPIRQDQLLAERRLDDKGKDLWTLFNVVSENIMRGGLKGINRDSNGRLRRTTTRPVKALDRNIKLNQALWLLTEKMAELKNVEAGSVDCIGLIYHLPLRLAVSFGGRLFFVLILSIRLLGPGDLCSEA